MTADIVQSRRSFAHLRCGKPNGAGELGKETKENHGGNSDHVSDQDYGHGSHVLDRFTDKVASILSVMTPTGALSGGSVIIGIRFG
jgi:hypothetical protein